jgi:hypothetical protein
VSTTNEDTTMSKKNSSRGHSTTSPEVSGESFSVVLTKAHTHRGQVYKKGETLTVNARQRDTLIALGVVKAEAVEAASDAAIEHQGTGGEG